MTDTEEATDVAGQESPSKSPVDAGHRTWVRDHGPAQAAKITLIATAALSASCAEAPNPRIWINSIGISLDAPKTDLVRFAPFQSEPADIFYTGGLHDNSSGLVSEPSARDVVAPVAFRAAGR